MYFFVALYKVYRERQENSGEGGTLYIDRTITGEVD